MKRFGLKYDLYLKHGSDIKKNTISLSPPQARKNWVLDAFLTIGDGSKMVIKKIFFLNRICKLGI